MPRLLLTPEASNDLIQIGLYIEADSPTNADRFLRKIEDAMRRLSEFPGMGQRRDDLAPDLRSFPVGNYLIFYLPLRDGIDVVRVLHGARDLRRLFQPE
jgi:toxin ParE1/3/4